MEQGKRRQPPVRGVGQCYELLGKLCQPESRDARASGKCEAVLARGFCWGSVPEIHFRAALPFLMHTFSAADLIAALNWRYATKQFDPARKIPATDWAALEESLRLAPSSFGLQPWKFIVVETPALRAKLGEASWGQPQITAASHLVVLVVKQGMDAAHIDRFMADTAASRGVAVEALAGYRKMIDGFVAAQAKAGQTEAWSTKQVYIAAGQFMASAAVMGIDTCPLEGIDPAKYDELLGLAGTGWATRLAITAGYRAATDKYATAPKVRFPAAEILEHR